MLEPMTMIARLTCPLALVGLIAAAAAPALAHWRPQYANQPPQIRQWYQAQHNKRGQWCCDKSDGHAYFGQYTLNADGSVTLHVSDNETRTLPSYMVLQGANPTGHAVWWYAQVGNYHKDYCFAPGSLT